MPNWVHNVVGFTGTKKQIEDIRALCAGMDFDKIIPRPETLGIPSSSTTENALLAYVKFILKDENLKEELLKRFWSRTDEKVQECMEEYAIKGAVSETAPYGEESADLSYLWKETEDFRSSEPKSRADFIALGRIAHENIVNHGYYSWYDWNCAVWGTKWNTSDVDENTNKSGTHVQYIFNTAWSMPIGIMEKIFEKIKDTEVAFIWDYADEDIGSNCGRVRKDSDSNELQFSHEDEAEFAKKVWAT